MTSLTSARHPRRWAAVSASLAALLFATACANGSGSEDSTDSPSPTTTATQEQGQDNGQNGEQEGETSGDEQSYSAAAVGTGTGDVEALSSLSLEIDDAGVASIGSDTPVEADEVSSRVLKAGEGELIQDGDIVPISTVAADPETGEKQNQNFSTGAEAIPVDQNLAQRNPVLHEMLRTSAPGAEVAFYIPSQTSPAADGSENTVTLPAQMLVFRVGEPLALHAEGTELPEADRNPALPEVTVDADTQEPSIGTPDGDAPEELVVETLIEGEGDVVGVEDRVTVQYTGVTWSEGTEFDSSWTRGEPAQFALNQVIEGWTEGLAGQKEGSRVLLAIPAELAYGEQGSPPNIGPNEPLVFVVDILHTQRPMEPSAAE
ncbi:MAG: FKBP-type peptidyl-prolyl cis-trans isomerase [Micrococcus sp.]|nr:FKBP-type peptidyl-prolyl cis-trans isomerase [Micrococcus sp.]